MELTQLQREASFFVVDGTGVGTAVGTAPGVTLFHPKVAAGWTPQPSLYTALVDDTFGFPEALPHEQLSGEGEANHSLPPAKSPDVSAACHCQGRSREPLCLGL